MKQVDMVRRAIAVDGISGIDRDLVKVLYDLYAGLMRTLAYAKLIGRQFGVDEGSR